MKLHLSQRGQGLLGVAGAGFVLSTVYLLITLRYPMGSPSAPGMGVYPLVAGGLLFIGAVGAGVAACSEALQGKVDWPRGAGRFRLLAIIAALISYLIILPYAGNAVALVVVVLITLQVMGGLRWYVRVGLSLAIALSSHYLFSNILKVPLPRGTWFN